MKRGKILNSFARVRLFGEDYTIKEPTTIPRLYELRKKGAICHVKMEHAEWLMNLANKYRHEPLAQIPINIDISGIIVYPAEDMSDFEAEGYEKLQDLIIQTTKLESKNEENQVYVLDCYEKGHSKSFLQTMCNIANEVAVPYIIRPNPIPFNDSVKLKRYSEVASAILLGIKIYINILKIGKTDGSIITDIYVEPFELFGRSVV